MQLSVFSSSKMILLALLCAAAWPGQALAQARARFEVPSGTFQVLDTLRFVNASKNAVRYEWDFGDGSRSTDANPAHRYLASGEFTVTLTAYDANDRSRSADHKVRIGTTNRCLALIQTPMGDMLIQLYDGTPAHQDNFVKLVEQNYYDSLLFHRVIQGFMIQGGDPASKGAAPNQPLGSGGPNYTVKAEFADSLAHTKGALAAARTNNPQKRSSGSQFYLVQGKPVTPAELDRIEAQKGFRYPRAVREAYAELGGTPFLDQDYTVYGRVIEGLDVIDRIAAVRTGPNDRPQEDVWMVIRLVR